MTTFIGPYAPGVPLQKTQRPVVGEIRFNTTTSHMETYNGTDWSVLQDNPFSDKLQIETGKEKFGECEYWVQVTVPGLFSQRRQQNIEINEWVEQTYGPKSDWGYGRWTASDERYWFKEEKDRDWFVLRWSA